MQNLVNVCLLAVDFKVKNQKGVLLNYIIRAHEKLSNAHDKKLRQCRNWFAKFHHY